jgi:ppGpp synthetase/RelA/SpoT-type nucleotidyltranferase
MSVTSLSVEDIQNAVLRYEREYDRYEKLTQAVYERCLRIVDESGVRATVQRRTKSPQSLRKKLLRIQKKAPVDVRFCTVDDVFANMGDLAAVRIGSYLESDRSQLVNELRQAFEFLPEHEGHPNPDFKNMQNRAKHYRAVHCQVNLKPQDLLGQNSNLAGTSCEIQVCSMLAHVWNEIEHDLGYKPETGSLSERELDCLDALGQLARAGDVIIKTLLDANKERVVAIKTTFESQFDFMTRMQARFQSASNFHLHAAQLFDVLLELGLDSPSKIDSSLIDEGPKSLQRAQDLCEQLAKHIERTNDEIVSVDPKSSDQLAMLLLDKKLKELLDLYPTGRGMGRPLRLVSLAKRFEAMKSESGTAPAPGKE